MNENHENNQQNNTPLTDDNPTNIWNLPGVSRAN